MRMDSPITNAESSRGNRPSRRIWRRLLLVILFLGLVYLLIVGITQMGQRGTLTVPIVLVNSLNPGLSAATIDVSYDPTLIQVSGCKVVAPELRAGDCYRYSAVNPKG